MSNQPHPDKQYDRYCTTCLKMTKQVVMDKNAMYCTICCSVVDPPMPETSETLKAMMVIMNKAQKLEREIINGRAKG